MTTVERHRHAQPIADLRERCNCGHTRAAHDGRLVASRDNNGRPRPPGRDLIYLDACGLQLCGCEIFRGEADR